MAVIAGMGEMTEMSLGGGTTFRQLVTETLQTLINTLDEGVVYLRTTEGENLHVERESVLDDIGVQLETALDLCESYCASMLTNGRGSIRVASTDPSVAAPQTTRLSVGACTGVSLIRPDGHVFGILCVLHRVTHEAEPPEVALLSLTACVILQAAASRELAQSEERYRMLLELSPTPLVIHHESVFRYLNPAAMSLLGVASAEELLGTSIFEVAHPDDRDRAIAQTLAAQHAQQSIDQLAIRLVARDGAVIYVELSSVPMIYGDESARQVIVRDVTERVRAEQLLQGQSDILEMLATGESLSTTLLALVRLIEQLCPEMLCSILLLEEDGEHLRHEAAQNLPTAFSAVADHIRIGPRAGSCGTAAYTRRHVVVTDIAQDDLWTDIRHLALPHGLRACWSTPILSSTKSVLGTFAVYYREPRTPADEHVRLIGIAAHLASISIERKRDESTLREREGRYRSLVEASPDGIFLVNIDGTVTMANQQAAILHGYANAADLAGVDGETLVAPEDRALARARLARVLTDGKVLGSEYTLLKKDGSTATAELNASVIHDAAGKPAALTAVIRDISARKHAEEALEHQALHDALTGLPNRTLFHDRLNRALVAARRDATTVALLLLDLDRFKDINDTFGHHFGDLLLKQVAERLQTVLRANDTVARLGGDEFAIVLPSTGKRGANLATRKVLSILERPFLLEGHAFTVGASIGIVLYPQHGQDVETLVRRADVAMYASKDTDVSHLIYTAGHDRFNAERLALMSDLRHAIEHNQLLLHYQPQISLLTRKIQRVEALLRWNHPQKGAIPPSDFIALAEHSGVIKPLGYWVVNEAVRQCRAWQDDGLFMPIGINLSARNLADPRLADTVEQGLKRWELEPSVLTIELTESDVMSDPDLAMGTLTRLHRSGIRVSIDDFGTGYSSLAYLKRLPVDEIKIDQSFVREMSVNEEDASIVRSMVQLGHSLDLHVVAEGVETQQALDMLAVMSCDTVQGYYLAKPMSAADIRSTV